MNSSLKNIKEKLPDLTYLSKCSPKIRKYIIENGDKKLIQAIQECLYNFLKGNLKIEHENFDKLKKFKKTIRILVGTNCLKKNKRILVQKGGFIQYLLPIAVDLISNLIANTLSKISEK